MSKGHASTPQLFFAGYNLSGWLNKMDLVNRVGELEASDFSAAGIKRLAGEPDWDLAFSGFLDEDDTVPAISKINQDNFATDNRILTICPKSGDDGDPAYFSQGMTFNYEHGLNKGELKTFAGAAKCTGTQLWLGTIMAAGAKGSSGSGTIRQLGAVTASQKLYAVLQVSAVSGTDTPTITVYVKSDPVAGFTTATQRIAFTAKTAIGAQYATPVDGAITDTYWRINWVVSGTNPSLTINVALAIA